MNLCARGIDADFFVVYVHMICACVSPLHSIETGNEESSREGKFNNQPYRSMQDKIFNCLAFDLRKSHRTESVSHGISLLPNPKL